MIPKIWNENIPFFYRTIKNHNIFVSKILLIKNAFHRY